MTPEDRKFCENEVASLRPGTCSGIIRAIELGLAEADVVAGLTECIKSQEAFIKGMATSRLVLCRECVAWAAKAEPTLAATYDFKGREVRECRLNNVAGPMRMATESCCVGPHPEGGLKWTTAPDGSARTCGTTSTR